MSFLQQPVLFASEPNSSLVGLGLLITLTALVVVISLLYAFAVSSRERTPSKPACEDQKAPAESDSICGEPALQ